MVLSRYFVLYWLGLFGAGFALAAPSVPKQVLDNGLVYCTHSLPVSLNPQTADIGTNTNIVADQIYNKLFELSGNDNHVVPSLATSYYLSTDGRTITINLRRGVKFHKTEWFTPTRDFNAEDVVFSLNRIIGKNDGIFPADENVNTNSSKVSQYALFNEKAKNKHFPYFESIRLRNKIESVVAINPYQVQIHLVSPDASVLSHLSGPNAVILSYEYALQLNADDNLAQLDTLPVGTGPYQLKSYFRDRNVRLVRNDEYWGERANIKNVVIDVSTTKTGRLAKFLNGECDIVAFPDASQLKLLNERLPSVRISVSDSMNLAFVALNMKRQVMQNVDTRRAIAFAINRQRIIKHIYYGTAKVAQSIIPQISWASRFNATAFDYDYDPEKARSLLTNKNLTLSFWVIDEEQVYDPNPIKMAEMIKYDLAKVGIKVNIKVVSYNFLKKRVEEGKDDYDMILTGWVTNNLDPDSFLRPILSCPSQSTISNLSSWCHPPMDALLVKALQTDVQLLRSLDYDMAQQIIVRQVPIIPIATVNNVLVANNRVAGINMTPFGNIHFRALSLNEVQK
ncbi:ABC transporter substrate-binding protein [Gallibacterium salpingitidis]|uniref:Peptide ABC transporter substrate-binding protein n=1 Tax=Gallibacterium salpingitidis TaxID=505341 RepID=A0A1A7NW62_9PAST|nr:ABC transporter substrate-binding protein [Gallibacterium salpingitidis]OBW94447.1 peptide ABC transporter substrate-binding protein [Gallibacterium salpingitidis]